MSRVDEAWLIKETDCDEPVKDIEIPKLTDEERKERYGTEYRQPIILHYWSGAKKECVVSITKIKKEDGEL